MLGLMQMRRWLTAAVLLAASSVRLAAEPTIVSKLASFEGSDLFDATGTAPHRMVTHNATDGFSAVRVDFSGGEAQTFGVKAKAPVDFSEGDKLRFDVFRPGGPAHIILRVFDNKDRRYVCWYYLLQHGWNEVEYSVLGMKNYIDVRNVTEIVFYSEKPIGEFFVDHFRITKGPSDDRRLIPKNLSEKVTRTDPRSILTNGDFELGLQHWDSWGDWDDGKYVFGTGIGENAVSGSASASITCQKPGRGGIFTDPMMVPPGIYQLTFFAKGAGSGVEMYYCFDGEHKEGMSNPFCERVTIGPEWKEYRFIVKVTSEVGPVRLYLFSTGAGTLYLDAVSFAREGDRSVKPVVEPPDTQPTLVEVRGAHTLVNGKPFFPIGLFNARPEALVGTGFNLVMPINSIDQEFLDRCVASGVYSTVNLMGIARAHTPWLAPKAISRIKKHPAIFGWYVCDEPDHVAWTVPPAEMRLASELLNQEDPNHPTWTVVMSWADSNLFQYADAANILATDIYPIEDAKTRRPLIEVANKTDALLKATRSQRPAWVVVQASKFGNQDDHDLMTYLAIIHGANGVLFWEYNEALEAPATWDAVKQLSLELKYLTPALLAPSAKNLVTVSDDRIHRIIKQVGNDLYLICVNTSPTALSNVRFAVSGVSTTGPAKVLFEARAVDVQTGQWVDAFKPSERHVYLLKPTSGP